MNVNDIEDVLNLGTILSTHGNKDAAHQPHLIAALLDWKNDTPATAPVRDTVQETVAKVNQAETEPEPVAPPAKKAPAKAAPKSKAKPAPVADDDDADF